MRFVVTNSIDLHWFSVYQNCPHFYAVNNPGCLEIRVQKIFPVSIECSKKDIILIKWFCPKLINVIALLKLLADISRVSEGWSFFFQLFMSSWKGLHNLEKVLRYYPGLFISWKIMGKYISVSEKEWNGLHKWRSLPSQQVNNSPWIKSLIKWLHAI